MKWLAYASKNLTGRQSKSLLQHLSIITTVGSSVDLLSSVKSDAAQKYITSYLNADVSVTNLFSSFYMERVVPDQDIKTWDQVYALLDVSCLRDYDGFFICANAESPASRVQRNSKKGKFPVDSVAIRWISMGLHFINLITILKAHNEYGIPIHELLFDPNEMAYSEYHDDYKPKHKYVSYHGYDVPEYGLTRLDSLQTFFSKHTKSDLSSFFDDDTKEYDFTFGYAIFPSTDRLKYKQYLKDFSAQFSRSNLYVLDKVNGENTFIDTSDYFDKIKKSRFTYVLPAADTKCFSIYRLIESLYQDCLPIINRDCKLGDVEASYGVDLSPLVLDSGVSESQRLELLEYYKSAFCKVERGLQL